MKTVSDKIIKFRWIIIIFFLAVSLLFGSQLKKAELDPDMLNYIPENIPSKISKEKIEELFGGTEMLLVLIKTDNILNKETLIRVKNISRRMKRLKGVDKILSLFDLKNIKSEEGMMIVEPAVKRIPETKKEQEELRKEITGNDIVFGSVVSEDFKITAVIAMIKTGISDEFLVGETEKIISEIPGSEEAILGGTPYSRLNTAQNTKKDLGRLLPIGLLIMLIFLYFCFRQIRGVLLPFIVVIMSIMFSMGLVPVLGWKITAVTIILPVFLIAVANDYGIHMIAKYQEDNFPGNTYTRSDLAKMMFTGLKKPVLMTGITTMVGMLCLLGHILIPAEQLGLLAAAGIVYALAASLFFIPALISMLPKTRPLSIGENPNEKRPILEKVLSFFGNYVSKKPKIVISSALIFTMLISLGIFSIVVNTDPIKYYSKDHPVARSAELINKNLGGFFTVSVVFEGDIKDPNILKKIDRLEKDIKSMPEVGNTTSVARVVRQMSRVLNDESEPGYDKIPDTRNAVAQYFELYSMSGDPDDFEKMVDFPYEHALVTARINTSSTPVLSRVVSRIKEMVKGDPDVKYIGGIADVFSDITRHMVRGQFISLGIAVLLVSVLMMLLFRSINAGILSSVPIILSMLILFGLMGLLNIELNMITALLSSIMIGVGIDYTIHFLWRYKEERKHGLKYETAVNKTLLTTGRGIVFNAFSVIIGFMVLLISGFIPVRFFGFLVIVCIFSCLIGALILIPSLCIVLKPKFLEPEN